MAEQKKLVTLRDYAKSKHVSYEAIRKQVRRYAKDLGEHIVYDHRTQFLDEVAVAFLDDHRDKNPVIIYEQAKDEQIDELKKQVDELKTKLLEAQAKLNEANAQPFLLEAKENEIKSLKEQVGVLQIASDELADTKTKLAVQELENKHQQAEIEAKGDMINKLEAENKAQKEELEGYERTWFGLYRKKKGK